MPGFSYDGDAQDQWTTVPCDNSGPNCPQVLAEGDTVYVRDSERPDEVTQFNRAGFNALINAAKSGQLDHL